MAATSVKKVENKTARRGFLKWAKSRKGQQTLIILAFTIIPLVLLAAFTYVPFAEMVKFSFYKMKYSTPVDKRVFVGWKNYIEVFRNKDIFASLWLSLYYMVGSVVQLALALFLATILSFKTRGGNLFKGLMFFPYLISGIAIGFIFKYFYTRGFVFDSILGWFGFELDSLPYWLRDQKINNWSLVATSVWRYFGNNMVLFIGAIMSVDSEMYEAAELDGANKFSAVCTYHTAEHQDDCDAECDFIHHRSTERIRAAVRNYRRFQRNGNVFYQHEQYCTYQPEGRTRVGDGGCVTSYHFRMYDLTETVL